MPKGIVTPRDLSMSRDAATHMDVETFTMTVSDADVGRDQIPEDVITAREGLSHAMLHPEVRAGGGMDATAFIKARVSTAGPPSNLDGNAGKRPLLGENNDFGVRVGRPTYCNLSVPMDHMLRRSAGNGKS